MLLLQEKKIAQEKTANLDTQKWRVKNKRKTSGNMENTATRAIQGRTHPWKDLVTWTVLSLQLKKDLNTNSKHMQQYSHPHIREEVQT